MRTKQTWYTAISQFIGKSLRRLVGGWSLERKSLLFLGMALVIPIGLAFWFVLQVVANRLVMQTTRQAARDYARGAVAWEHVITPEMAPGSIFPDGTMVFRAEELAVLRKYLIDNPDYFTEYLMLDEVVSHAKLENSLRPSSAEEEELLRALEESFRSHLQALDEAKEAAQQRALERASDNPANTNLLAPGSVSPTPSSESDNVTPRSPDSTMDGSSLGSQNQTGSATDASPVATGGEANSNSIPDEPQPFDPATFLGASELEKTSTDAPEVKQAERALSTLFQDKGPYFPDPNDPRKAELVAATPPEGWYVYYHAIHFRESCFGCHEKFKEAKTDDIPFRVVKVLVPFAQTQVASTKTLAVMIAIAMVTVAATLLVVHWVLRRLVLNPLRHLHTVSDEIGRGNVTLRANIDTGDEFNELGDAFNRMMRHMTESREELENLNAELDLRVDQLAQANLHLYEANRLKSDFLANMSHELRTPLNSILGFSDVLQDIPSLNEKQRRYAANIQTSGKLLLEMINDILDLGKIEAGKMQVSPTSFNLSDLIEGQCDILRSLVDEKNVDLQIEIAPGMPDVFQDRPKIQQILTNLLSNAIKFTPDGGMITVRADLIRAGAFQITVADTGVGIPEDDFEIIFEKFRQSDTVLQNDGLTRQYAGTGLGLSIVKELCKLLGGEIRLTSQLGTGSTFQVLLPVQVDSDASPLVGS